LIRIEYMEQVIEIPQDAQAPIMVTIKGVEAGEKFLLQGETKKYILRVTKDRKLVLN